MTEKLFVTWDDINDMVFKLYKELKDENIDKVVGVSRGGLIPGVMLSHWMKKPFKPVKSSLRDYPQWEDYLPTDVDVVLIDANHTYPAVKKDIDNSLELFGKDVTFIFDDYGLPCDSGGPRKAIDEYVGNGILQIDKFIGEKPEDLVHAGGTKFFEMEGVICNL